MLIKYRVGISFDILSGYIPRLCLRQETHAMHHSLTIFQMLMKQI